MTRMSDASRINDNSVREVWQHNLEEEFKAIWNVITAYRFIAMDTEFPGVVFDSRTPYYDRRNLSDYQSIKNNVDLLSLIQLGLTFYDENGNKPQPISTWQFNFRFDLSKEPHSKPSIDLLKTSGIQFERLQTDGIDPKLFGEMLMVSGLVLMEKITWITFHGSYDFAYLLKILTCLPLPNNSKEFYELLNIYFMKLFDIKYLMFACGINYGGLQHLAETMGVTRTGRHHQAGSDSRVTGDVFFRMIEEYFQNRIDSVNNAGHIYGVEKDKSKDE